MIRVTPSEPYCDDPDAVWLRTASRPGPVLEPHHTARRQRQRIVRHIAIWVAISAAMFAAAAAPLFMG